MRRDRDLYIVLAQPLDGGAGVKCRIEPVAGERAASKLVRKYRIAPGADTSLYYWYQLADAPMPLNLDRSE